MCVCVCVCVYVYVYVYYITSEGKYLDVQPTILVSQQRSMFVFATYPLRIVASKPLTVLRVFVLPENFHCIPSIRRLLPHSTYIISSTSFTH